MSGERIPEQLLSALAPLKTATESIWDFSHDGSDLPRETASVFLIEERKIDQARNMEAIGLAGGEGRSLSFEKQDGRWTLVGEGRWIG